MINKKQIIETSAQLFKTYGIRSNTMDDIAHEAGISKKTLYQQLPDKETLVKQVIAEEKRKLQALLNDKIKNSVNDIETLIRINVLIIKFLQNINPVAINDLRKHFIHIYEQARIDFQQLFYGVIKTNLVSGKQNGVYRNDIHEDVIIRLHAERISKIKEIEGVWGQNADTPEIIKEMTSYYIRGLITQKGEIILNKHIVEFNKYLNE